MGSKHRPSQDQMRNPPQPIEVPEQFLLLQNYINYSVVSKKQPLIVNCKMFIYSDIIKGNKLNTLKY